MDDVESAAAALSPPGRASSLCLTLEDVKRLVDLQQLVCAPCPPPFLFRLAVIDVPLVLGYLR